MFRFRNLRWRTSLTGSSIVVTALLVSACNLDSLGTSLDIAGGGLTGIAISGDSVIVVGDTVRLEASGGVGGLLGMFSYDPLDDAQWSTGNSAIATVAPRESRPDEVRMARAMVRGIGPGKTFITVAARGFSAKLPMRVVAAPAAVERSTPRE